MDLKCKLDLHFSGVDYNYSIGASMSGPYVNASFNYSSGTFSMEDSANSDWDCEYCFNGDVIWGVKYNYGIQVNSTAYFVTPDGIGGSCATAPKYFRYKIG
jgi:hypothetical protein